MSSNLRIAMPVDVVSDVVCPWCFIGKRRLEKAIALASDIPLNVRWRPYFLNPWIPRQGIGRVEYLVTKFGSIAGYARIAERIAEVAAAEGLVYAVDRIARQPNTLDCHRLIRWAETYDTAGPETSAGRMKQRLMDLYFSEGADLTELDVLVQAAVDCGMDAAEVRARLDSDVDEREVAAEAVAASDAGVEGVPCFIFGGVLAVAGAQSPDYLAGAMARAFTQFEQRVAAGEIANPEGRPY
jgi:predicted DsbA family dithiol-disulfide isomerase